MSFNELFHEAVCSALEDTLGHEALAAFLYHSHLDLVKADTNDLHRSLLAIFREDGARILEMLIARRLYEKIGLRRNQDEPFETMVDQARQAYERNDSSTRSATRINT